MEVIPMEKVETRIPDYVITDQWYQRLNQCTSTLTASPPHAIASLY